MRFSFGYVIGALLILAGLLMAWWGAGNCIPLIVATFCPFLTFALYVFGGVSIALAGGVWSLYFWLRQRRRAR